jgi:hypothetical protein
MLPGVNPPINPLAFPLPKPAAPTVRHNTCYGEPPTDEHIFGDEHGRLHTAEQVIRAEENRAHCTIGPLPFILLRKNVITAEEFLEAVQAQGFYLV